MLLSSVLFPRGKSIQVVADGMSVITLPGFQLVVSTRQGSTGIGPFCIPSVRALQKKDEATEGEPTGEEALSPDP